MSSLSIDGVLLLDLIGDSPHDVSYFLDSDQLCLAAPWRLVSRSLLFL